MHAFVINLSRSTDRRAAMAEQLADSGLDVEFFAALDGRTLDRSPYPEAHQLNPGELGCYLSHVRAWQRLAESELDSALILEDDVVVDADLASVCRELTALPVEIDMVRVSSVLPRIGHALLPLRAGRRLLLPTRSASGSQGYWLTRRGAHRLLAAYQRPRRPIDKQLDRAWRSDLRILLLDPPAVRESGVCTTIGGRPSRRRPPYWLRKLEKRCQEFIVGRLARRMRQELHGDVQTRLRPVGGTSVHDERTATNRP